MDYVIGVLAGLIVGTIGFRLLYLDHVCSSINRLKGGCEWTKKNMSWKDLFSFRRDHFSRFVNDLIKNV